MADPQHPAVPFEQAVDLLTGEPRPLQPQHPGIAALVEELGGYANLLRMLHPKQNEKSAALVDRTIAALRTLERPVEDEEAQAEIERLRNRIGYLYRQAEYAAVADLHKTEDFLARLAREKASAEQERDALRAEFDQLFGRFTDESARATRAEQERDEARQNAVNAAEALRTLGLAHVEQGREVARLREKAAGYAKRELYALMSDISEEYWCAGWMSGNEFALWRMVDGGGRRYGQGEVSEEEVARLRELSDTAGGWWRYTDEHEPEFISIAEWRALAAAAGAEEPDQCPKCKDYVGRCPVCGRKRPSIEETRRALEEEPR